MTILKHRAFFVILIPVLFFIIYHQVFLADYAYLDEIHQLWHNDDDSNFRMFHTQGRWLSGVLFQKLFSSISSIDQLKWLRIFSLTGWVGTGIIWSLLLRRWLPLYKFSVQMWWIGSVYLVCSISVAIYIGWASCFQIFLSAIAGLLSGHILFMGLLTKKRFILVSFVLTSILLGIITLFIYQTAYGMSLIPFLLHYFHRKSAKPDCVFLLGVGLHLLTYGIYYILFKESLEAYNLEASTRTAINLNILSKVSFFFAGPLPQGFSLNLLFSARSVFSQVFYPLVIIIWIFSIFKRNKENSIAGNLLFIAVILITLAIIYLPLMIATEDFPSYRTLLAFNLAVFLIVAESILFLIPANKARNRFALVAILWLIVTGIYTFNLQYVNPLKEEYRLFKQHFLKNYNPSVDKVVFIRADKFMFTPAYNTMVYRDEFGAPSTYRDWVPEPIIKQSVLEITGDRNTSESIQVIQYENIDSFNAAKPLIDSNTLLINMNEIFYAK